MSLSTTVDFGRFEVFIAHQIFPTLKSIKIKKDLGRSIIQICPTYNDERCSRHMLIKINIYCQYIILTI